MKIKLLDGSWDVEVFLDRSEPDYDDNVFLRITEECPQEQKLLKTDQITIGIAAIDARELARRLKVVATPSIRSALGRADQLRHGISDARVKCRQPHPVLMRHLREVGVRRLPRG